MIPKRLHYVWVGGDLPDKRRACIETWRATNPQYEIVCWSEDNIDMTVPAIASAYARRRWATVADIVRLAVVLEHGGIYLDADFELRQSLDPLLQQRCFFVFQGEHPPSDWVCNGVFGAEPGNLLIRNALQTVLRMRPGWLGLDRPTSYGPKLITRLLREQGLQHYAPDGVIVGDTFICPARWFFPHAWDEAFDENRITSETIGVHLWEGSWKEALPAPVRWAKAIGRALQPARRRPTGQRI